jgi:hypothetical protein
MQSYTVAKRASAGKQLFHTTLSACCGADLLMPFPLLLLSVPPLLLGW